MSKASTSNVVPPRQHKVFINFRGEEVRCTFVSHLVDALQRKGIDFFIDKYERTGQPLTKLFDRIQESKIAIAVISSKYTESPWCLNELAKIHECAQKETLTVLPVFFQVEVDTVKNLRGKFGRNLRLLTNDDSTREVWRRALEFVTKILGRRVDETSDEAKVINEIVSDVEKELESPSRNQETKSSREEHVEPAKRELENSSSSSSCSKAYPLFGIETRLEQLKKKLDLESDKVTRIVGVVGMPGIGKTALAKKLLDDCGHKFYHTMFLGDVRQKSRSLGVDRLQRELLNGLKESQKDVTEQGDPDSTIDSLKAEFKESKVFIVLDDVTKTSLIEDILGGRDWFKEGSRVVITTSSMSVIKGKVDERYIVPGLSDSDALKYLEKYAFSGGCCEPSYLNLAKKVVDYSRGNPLALKVLGGELLKKDEAYWGSKVDTLAESPISNTIQKVLRIPYDNLDKYHKDLFLDVACLFSFEDVYLVKSVLDSSPHGNVNELRELADKFLINICGGRLEINDLMYTLALGLESASSSDRRLFNHGDISTILKRKAESTNVRGIFLDTSKVKRMSLGIDTFKGMNNLRYLKLYNSSCPRECEADCNLNFPNGLEFTLPAIRYLYWLKFPLKSLPQDFEPRNLIDLKLPYSQLEQLWEEEKDTSKLRWLDLSHSSELGTLSGLSLARGLQSMNLEGCTGLKIVHNELQNMGSLVFLNLRGCTSLTSLSEVKLISLKILILSGCSSLEEFNLVSENLQELYLDGTAIKELPDTIGKLIRLVLLTLKDCKRLESLPSSIENLEALQKLVLSGCSRFTSFPEIRKDLKHLKTLLIDGTGVRELPRLFHRFSVERGPRVSGELEEICGFSSVRRLCLSRNNSITSFPDDLSYLYNLKWLDIKYCEKLNSLPTLPRKLERLDAHGCTSLENVEKPLAYIETATEHPRTTFVFTNCAKLDQVARNRILSYARKKIQVMSDPLTHQDKGSTQDLLIGVCYPSWQIPVWFNHHTAGSELTQKLPRHWNEDGLTGIVLCAVVSFEGYRAESNRVLVKCMGELKERDSEPFFNFSCIFGGWTEHGSDGPREIIKSYGHVFIGYISLSEVSKWDRGEGCVDTEASFQFQVSDGTEPITNCEVLKCGFTFIYQSNKKHVHTDQGGKTPLPASTANTERSIKISEGTSVTTKKHVHSSCTKNQTDQGGIILGSAPDTEGRIKSEGASAVKIHVHCPCTENQTHQGGIIPGSAPNTEGSIKSEATSAVKIHDHSPCTGNQTHQGGILPGSTPDTKGKAICVVIKDDSDIPGEANSPLSSDATSPVTNGNVSDRSMASWRVFCHLFFPCFGF